MWSFDDFLFPFFILNLQGSARDMKRFTTSFIPNFTKKCEIAVRQLIYCGHLTIFFFIVTVQIPNMYICPNIPGSVPSMTVHHHLHTWVDLEPENVDGKMGSL